MTPILSAIEKIIASLIIIWGGIVLCSLINGLGIMTDTSISPSFSLFVLLKNFHSVFAFSLVAVSGGLFLLFNKKFGWMFSLISLILNIFFFLIPTERGKSLFNDKSLILFYSGLTVFSLLMIYMLALPAYKDKYNATRKNWWTIGLITLLIMLDKTFLYLAS